MNESERQESELQQISQVQQPRKDSMAETGFQRTTEKDNLATLVNNIKIYCSLLIENKLDQFQVSKYRYLLQNQMSDIWFEEPLKDFAVLVQDAQTDIEGYPLYKNLSNFEQICRQLMKMKDQAQNEEAYDRAHTIIGGFFKQIQAMIETSSKTIAKLNKYDVYGNNMDESVHSDYGKQQLPPDHYQNELIHTKVNFTPQVFTWVKPGLHKVYVSEASKAYHQIAPFRIKTIIPNSSESPQINVKNYFSQTTDQSKAILAYCIPGRKAVGYYAMSDICKLYTMEKQYYQERQLNNDWTFSTFTRSVTTPQGKIFAINSRTTKEKIEPCMYEITEVKASNRGPLPSPKRQSGFIYLGSNLYVIGGSGQGEKCSKKNFRYNLKDKKWHSVAESNVALRKPTLCALNNRYLLKIGGLNEFDYINKVIEIYDSITDKWSLVRATPKSITQQVQILEDSLAVQINDDEVFIFGGKNANKYNSDTGFILQINEIKERRKGAAKVNGQLWNVSVGKRNILTLLGQVGLSTVIVHFNCIYALRVKHTQALSI